MKALTVALVAAVASAIAAGFIGYELSEAHWREREAKWVRVANDERIRQEKALGKVQAEVERLKARPERVRTVTQEVVKYVQADAQCESLPPSWRVLWNIEPDGGSSAGTARVGDEALRAVAADPR
ncbi:MAG: hypothetical protein WDA07_06420 [Leucobacter sp.]